MQLSERVNRITVSATVAVLMEAERYRARGVDVVDFGPGEPDFPTPQHIKQAAVRALEKNLTKYTATPGIAPLREAICEWHATQFGSGYSPAECIVSVGGKHALFNAVCSLVNAGDEVIIPVPYWVSFPDIVNYAGGKPVFVPTPPQSGFRLRAKDVEIAITPRTRMLIVNSPNNPTGAVVAPDEFAALLELCRKRNIWLLSDETYSHLIYGDAKPFSVAGLPEAKAQVIVISSFSKTFSMTGWRVGYALAPEPLVKAMTKLQSQCTSNATSIAQYAALEALRGPLDSVAAMRTEYQRRRNRMVDGLVSIYGIDCSVPDGAFYVFPHVESLLRGRVPDTAALAQQLLEREHIAVVPGEAFGAPGFLRFSYATSMNRIEEGLKRLERFFATVSSAP